MNRRTPGFAGSSQANPDGPASWAMIRSTGQASPSSEMACNALMAPNRLANRDQDSFENVPPKESSSTHSSPSTSSRYLNSL